MQSYAKYWAQASEHPLNDVIARAGTGVTFATVHCLVGGANPVAACRQLGLLPPTGPLQGRALQALLIQKILQHGRHYSPVETPSALPCKGPSPRAPRPPPLTSHKRPIHGQALLSRVQPATMPPKARLSLRLRLEHLLLPQPPALLLTAVRLQAYRGTPVIPNLLQQLSHP